MGKRRKARELAIQLLYQIEMVKAGAESVLESFWHNNPHPAGIMEFTNFLVKGTAEHQEQIDRAISKTSTNWSFERLNPVDRGILREALFEIFHCPDIPYKVTLNESIELGKKFGSAGSSAFINGVLDHVRGSEVAQKKQVSS